MSERRQNLVGHLRRPGVDDGDAVAADRRGDVRAVGHEHVDIPLYGQHVYLSVFRTLVRNAFRNIVGRARRRNGDRVNLCRVDRQTGDGRAVLRIQRLDAAACRLERKPVVLLQELADGAILPREKVRDMVPVCAAVL